MTYDILVVGSGHAGIEAAYIAKKLNMKVALITFNKSDIGNLSCNVSIGGSAKGIVVKEIFALGGLMPLAADENQLQTKMLNSSKGPAVRAMRSQIDKVRYPKWIQNKFYELEIEVIEDQVDDIIIENGKSKGLLLKKKGKVLSKTVVLCTGTYLSSKTMTGKDIKFEGPDKKTTTFGISNRLKEQGVELIRLKTGTPPRIITNTIKTTSMIEEYGSDKPIYFTEGVKISKSFENIVTWLAHTNIETHKVIEKNIEKSYLYSSEITGSGPRYCPSIEDKVRRFSDKESHQIFLEIESKDMDTTYLTGMSSSLPADVQEKFLRTVKGFEKCEFKKYAYAIEYDAVEPKQLKQSLELKKIENIFCAGQINGTSGYEEAAAQGLMAAVNAANKINKKDPLVLNRDQAYIGVLINDITSKGVSDPYRLLSSRAEYRLLLRHDNATKRLFQISFENGLISKKEYQYFKKRFDAQQELIKHIEETKINLKENNLSNENKSVSLLNLIKMPENSIFTFSNILSKKIKELDLSNEDLETVNIEIKFKGYIDKQEREVAKNQKYLKYYLPIDFDYNKIKNISKESIEKLNKVKPETVFQASQISGIKPSDVLVIINYFNGRKKTK